MRSTKQNKLRQGRLISRRQILAAGGAAAVGSVALAAGACGGDSSNNEAGKPKIGPIEQNKIRRFGTGLTGWNPDKTFDGLTIFSPSLGASAYALDMEGKVVNEWNITEPGSKRQVWMVNLLENGNLFALVHEAAGDAPPFVFKGGHLMEIDWDGKVVWELADNAVHHDAAVLPNGNLFILRAEPVPPAMAGQIQGGLAGTEEDSIWTDYVVETTKEGEVIWEWHAWEHMDPSIEISNPQDTRAEWTHANSVFQTPDGDLLISCRNVNTVAIADRGSGALTWRLSAPTLAQQHHATMLENGNVLIFDNGAHRLDNAVPYSRVIEVNPENDELVWEYTDPTLMNFLSPYISGAQRLQNGNTLITEGNHGRIFEVTAEIEIVWEYVSPYFTVNPFLGENNSVFRAYRYPDQRANG